MRNFDSQDSYNQSVHSFGRITLLIGLLMTFTLPITLWLFFDLIPSGETLAAAFVSVSSVLLPTAIIETLTYAPLLGSSGLYITTLTGSYMNVRIPSALSAMEAAGVERGSEQADLVSTIGIAMSAFVSVGIMALAMIFSVPLQPIISAPVLQPAFDTILSAVFGALTMNIVVKNPKHCIVPLVCAFFIVKFSLIPETFQIPAMVVLSLAGNRILYKLHVL